MANIFRGSFPVPECRGDRMKILVTGAAGFIGSNFCYYMADKHPDDKVVMLDALTYAGNLETLEPLMGLPNLSFVKADIADKKRMFELFDEERFDVVVNFAAETHVDRSSEDPGIFLTTNVIGTETLLDASKEFDVKRFHQIGTDEVYGDLPLDRPDLFFREDMPLKASSPYSASKASADLLALAYHRTYGLPVTVSRCSNNYGPFQFPEKLIPLVIYRAMNDETIPVYGTGENVRDWLYVMDHVKAVDVIIRDGKVGEIYNIGGHNERNNLTVVKKILEHLGKSESLITFVTDRKGHDKRYAIAPDKIHSELGWEPETAFEDGIKSTIDWYLDHHEWWEHIVSGDYQNYYKKMYEGR